MLKFTQRARVCRGIALNVAILSTLFCGEAKSTESAEQSDTEAEQSGPHRSGPPPDDRLPFDDLSEAPQEALATRYRDSAPGAMRGIWMGTTYHTRTGFYANATAGGGYSHIFRSSEASQLHGTEAFEGRSNVRSLLSEIEVSLGGSIARDFSLGLVARLANAESAKLSSRRASLNLRGGLTSEFFGLTARYYFHPENGWFIGSALGFTQWRARVEQKALDQIGGNGVALAYYGGREYWLGSNFALGALARIEGAVSTGDIERRVDENQIRGTETDYSMKLSAALTLTYY